MMKNIRDMTAAEFGALPETLRNAVDDFVARGYKREHLVVVNNDEVMFDPELCDTDGLLDAMEKVDSTESK